MANEQLTRAHDAFDAPDLWASLEARADDPARYDELDFGLVVMDLEGTILAYNSKEAELAGLEAERVLDLNFFTDVAPCTNNYLVSGRFEDDGDIDETIDYVFSVRMRPVRVRLRMLRKTSSRRQYLAVDW